MPEARRFSQLSPARQTLVRGLQAVNFGELQGIQIQDADPMFDDTSVVILDVKLDKEEMSRPELGLADFALGAEVLRLMCWLDELKNGTIQRLEVRAGIPRRLLFASRLLEVLSGFGVVNLSDFPNGLSANEAETFLRALHWGA